MVELGQVGFVSGMVEIKLNDTYRFSFDDKVINIDEIIEVAHVKKKQR